MKRRMAEPPGSIATALRNTTVCKVHDIHHLQAVLEAYAAQASCFSLVWALQLLHFPVARPNAACCAAWLVQGLAARKAFAPHFAGLS